MCGLALILAVTLFPYQFSFDEVRSFTNRFGLSRTIAARGNDLIIGADPVLGQRFKGRIDELRIYGRALTPLQVAQEAKPAFAVDRQVPPGSAGIRVWTHIVFVYDGASSVLGAAPYLFGGHLTQGSGWSSR